MFDFRPLPVRLLLQPLGLLQLALGQLLCLPSQSHSIATIHMGVMHYYYVFYIQ